MPAITEENSASALTFTSFEIPSRATRLVIMLIVIVLRWRLLWELGP